MREPIRIVTGIDLVALADPGGQTLIVGTKLHLRRNGGRFRPALSLSKGTGCGDRRVATPGGKARQVFEAVSRLPRRKQQKIVEVVEALVAQHAHTA